MLRVLDDAVAPDVDAAAEPLADIGRITAARAIRFALLAARVLFAIRQIRLFLDSGGPDVMFVIMFDALRGRSIRRIRFAFVSDALRARGGGRADTPDVDAPAEPVGGIARFTAARVSISIRRT